jgi:hypothetical protein
MTTTVAVSCCHGDVLGGVIDVDDGVVELVGTEELVEESGTDVDVVVLVDDVVEVVVDVVVEASTICRPNTFI